MNRGTFLLLLLALVSLPHGSASAANYMCASDQLVGFSFDKERKEWRQIDSKPTEKYLVIPGKESGVYWQVFKLGEDHASSWCTRDDPNYLLCDGYAFFRMNRSTLRFLRAYTFGFWSPPEGRDTPTMEIGQCHETTLQNNPTPPRKSQAAPAKPYGQK